ncbi:MAG: bifunctional 5,10-methylenetetrahydrofolate dehydrogenase/5,10-methenyltetrahydrofolate cyclohydrolase [Candidatus Saccharibacteria bacterium]|nr:bifunctional 5,10-methylenetetrahydrofolate dehydrogenase/5,10-methenyltetrahydrofolate cyclohydrolase [Candidatus Saccharibacteria bacterium]
MKSLNGAEIVSYIKVRQAQQVRALRQAEKIYPRLAIIITTNDPVIDTYVRLKQAYGADILVDVDECRIDQDKVIDKIKELNNDKTVHGIIVQLPLNDSSQTDEIVQNIEPKKDVDGLADGSPFISATPMAIDWLLAGYNVDIKNKKIVIVGKGRLVGGPLSDMWTKAGHNVTVVEEGDDLAIGLRGADIIVTATGKPGLIKSEIIPIGAAVVDAGVSSEEGGVRGDVDELVYDRDDLTITPRVGGVGPLTIAALFDNVIRSARP